MFNFKKTNRNVNLKDPTFLQGASYTVVGGKKGTPNWEGWLLGWDERYQSTHFLEVGGKLTSTPCLTVNVHTGKLTDVSCPLCAKNLKADVKVFVPALISEGEEQNNAVVACSSYLWDKSVDLYLANMSVIEQKHTTEELFLPKLCILTTNKEEETVYNVSLDIEEGILIPRDIYPTTRPVWHV